MALNRSNDWSDSPVFIIGNPRSGTTVLRLMLSRSPQLFIPVEGGFMIFLHDKYRNFIGDMSEVMTFAKDVVRGRKMENWKLTEDDIIERARLKQPKDYTELCACVYESYGELYYPGIKRWGDKNNFHLHHVGLLNDMFPKACFIHIYRDGRDVACSYKDMSKFRDYKYSPKVPLDIQATAKEWRDNINEIKDSLSRIDARRVIELKYEDLVTAPAETLKRLCLFLNIEYTHELLSFHQIVDDTVPFRDTDMPWKKMNDEPVSAKRVGRWLSELSPEEVCSFETIAGKCLENLGYGF